MTNSIFLNKDKTIISPGIILYNNVINFTNDDINSIISTEDYIKRNYEKYHSSKIKNTFFHGLNKINKKEMAENVQKVILHYFAKYCDLYPEVIHTIQWQENIFIDIEYPGGSSFIFNTNKSFVDETQAIKSTPFSRQVAVEFFVEDSYEGGEIEWIYLNDVKINNPSSGSILFYPANYLFSKKHNTIIKGRKTSLTTFFNGGKDFLSEENNLEEDNLNFLFSYMR